jgi:hypothetical protein
MIGAYDVFCIYQHQNFLFFSSTEYLKVQKHTEGLWLFDYDDHTSFAFSISIAMFLRSDHTCQSSRR